MRALEIREAQTLATEEPQRSSATRRRGEAAGSKQGQSEGRRPGFLPTPPAWLAVAGPPNSTLCLSLFTINTGVHITFGFSIANQRKRAPRPQSRSRRGPADLHNRQKVEPGKAGR